MAAPESAIRGITMGRTAEPGGHEGRAMTIQAGKELRYPSKPVPGDRVAILSPASGLPDILPLPFELGLCRLREDFGLAPVEYPTTRRMNADPRDRARDVMDAFTDPSIKAILTSIGGSDEIRILPFLDRNLIVANPKPFFGYSDNTNLLAYLWNSGVIGYYGGSVMYHLGRPGALHPHSTESLRAALFTSGEYELRPATTWRDEDRDWADPATFESEPAMKRADGWHWHNGDHAVEGTTWGGCFDVITLMAIADREIASPEAYEGCVFLMETSEVMPRPAEVGYALQSFGERGILGRFAAVVVGRPMTAAAHSPEDRATYAPKLEEVVVAAVDRYAPGIPIVFNVDFGHTDPQLIIPFGGRVRIDGVGRRIWVTY
jgi:muramoyltetrapeptide carboxypeptidase LdcA involved in peptidoglycan recycling